MKPSRVLPSAFVVLMLALAVTVLLRGRVPADPPTPVSPSIHRPAKAADRTAAIASIQIQLKAFARDDYQTASLYQSTDLKRNFPSVEAFRSMMQRAYPEFAHYKAAQFGKAQSDASGQHLAILVTLTGQDGVTVHAIYMMVREGKVYHVSGVAGGAQLSPFDNDNGPVTPGMDV